MTLSELILAIGDENIKVQNIEHSLIHAKINRKHKDCEITFSTEFDILNNNDKVGLVIWLDREQFEQELKEKDNER